MFIQLAEAWGPRDSHVHYRDGFREYVHLIGDPSRDRVILLEPNPARAEELRAAWASWPRLEVLEADLGRTRENGRRYYVAAGDAGDLASFAPDSHWARRLLPNAEQRTVVVPAVALSELLHRLALGSKVGLLSLDLRRGPALDMDAIDLADLNAEAVAVTWARVPKQVADGFDDRMLQAGYWRGGRGWGPAGSGRLYRRITSPGAWIDAALHEARVVSGAVVVHLRDRYLAPDRRAAWRLRARVVLRRGVSRSDVLDDHFGIGLEPVPTMRVRELLERSAVVAQAAWGVSLGSEPDPMDTATECHDRHGVWPISFSYPGHALPILGAPEELVSPIIPGYPYSFDDESEYLATYQRAYLGVTHRKAGWDCFRHVEIMASGAVPLMPDAREIPQFAMIHYPKQALTEVATRFRESGGRPDDATRQGFRQHFERYLTSRAMAHYILGTSGLQGVDRVLFVDAALPGFADYQSVLTLIGLKQLLGSRCQVQYPLDYIYEDTEYPVQSLYGRGFGYTRVVSGDARSASELGAGPVDFEEIDAIVVGSVTRNGQLARDLLKRFPPSRTIWIHGEDGPPTIDEAHELRTSGAHVYVRAIHTGRQ